MLARCLNNVLSLKALVGTFSQDVIRCDSQIIVNPRLKLYSSPPHRVQAACPSLVCDHSVAGAIITPCLGWKPIAAPTFLPHSCQQTAPAADVTIMLMYEVFSLLHASECKSECYPQHYNKDLPCRIVSVQPTMVPALPCTVLQCCIQYPVVLTMCSALLQVEPWSWSPHTLHIPDQAPVPITTITLKPQTSCCSHKFGLKY